MATTGTPDQMEKVRDLLSEALLLASIPVTENEMRELAVARGVAVKDQLVKKQIPLDRLFLGSPSVSVGNTAVTTGLKLEPR